MKKMLQLAAVVLTGLLSQSSQAATYTNYLDDASNAMAQVYAVTEGTPHNLLGAALKNFEKKSTSVAGDYNIFLSISTKLLPLLGTPGTEQISGSLSNAFNKFVTEAAVQAGGLAAQLDTVSEWQKSRRAASNQLAQVQKALLVPQTTTNLQFGMLSVRLAFAKLAAASKLTSKAVAAGNGFAPDMFEAGTVTFTVKGETETVTFANGEFSFPSGETGGYQYARNGLSTGFINLLDGTEVVAVINLKFSTPTSGNFTVKGVFKGSGTFTMAFQD